MQYEISHSFQKHRSISGETSRAPFSCFSLFGKLFILVLLACLALKWSLTLRILMKECKIANLWLLHCSLLMILRNIFYDEIFLKLENAQY